VSKLSLSRNKGDVKVTKSLKVYIGELAISVVGETGSETGVVMFQTPNLPSIEHSLHLQIKLKCLPFGK
jgi:hypothetical protein